MRLHLLMRGVRRNWQTCFKAATPPVAPSSTWGHILIFFPRLMGLQKPPIEQNPERLSVILENLLVVCVQTLPRSDQE